MDLCIDPAPLPLKRLAQRLQKEAGTAPEELGLVRTGKARTITITQDNNNIMYSPLQRPEIMCPCKARLPEAFFMF